MNNTIKTQLNHTTIRKFKNQNIQKDTLNTLLDIANKTSSSMGMQSYSIIRIKDKDKRKKISEICKQPYVETVPELLIFIVDVFRNSQISKEMGEDLPNENDMDRFFQGFTDGAIACQNMVVAIESLGMGVVYLGSILNNSKELINLLNLPKLTFPIVGLGFGYPDEKPQLKPRMDLSMKVFEDNYHIQDNYLKAIEEYDSEMENYYDLRDPSKSVPPFSQQVINVLKNKNENRSGILNIIREQGFDFRLKD